MRREECSVERVPTNTQHVAWRLCYALSGFLEGIVGQDTIDQPLGRLQGLRQAPTANFQAPDLSGSVIPAFSEPLRTRKRIPPTDFAWTDL